MITIIVKGGVVQEVISDKKQKAIVLDFDIEGLDENRTRTLCLLDDRRVQTSVNYLKTSSKSRYVKKLNQFINDFI